MKINLKKLFITLITVNVFNAASQSGAVAPVAKALSFDTVEESVDYLTKTADALQAPCDKRVLLAFTGSVQEQAALYVEASLSFAKAAGITVEQSDINSFILKKDARPEEKIVYSMLKKTSGILVLDAVRCSLNAGESKTALSYLNSSIRNSKDEKIQAKIKLYEIWAKLCDAESEQELEESVVLLKAYASMQSMESVLPSILFTLWYINNESSAASQLKSKFPNSIEAAVVSGATSLMPTPFWLFVPKKGNVLSNVNDAKASSLDGGTAAVPSSASSAKESETEKVKRQQVGLFGKQENAQGLVQRLKEKGFNAYIEEEKRPSGNIYYIVIVNENQQGNMGLQLKTAGFDCYPIY